MTKGRDLNPEEKKLAEDVRVMTIRLKNTVERLRELADYLDEVWSDCQRVSAFGTCVGILGSVLTIAGGVATIMTGGAAAPLLGVGTTLGVAAAYTNLGTSAVEAQVNSNIMKEAEQELEMANLAIQKVKNQINELRQVKSAFRWLFCIWLVTILVRRNPLITPFLRQLLPTGLLSTIASSAIHNVGKASTKSTGAFIIGVSVVFLIVDIIDLNYKVRDIVKNKGSGAARVLRGKANECEAILKGYQ